MRRAAAILVVLLAACSGGSSEIATTTTTTTTAPTSTTAACPSTFTFGTTRLAPECQEQGLTAALRSQNVTVDSTGPAQAQSICRKVIASGPSTGVLEHLADWETGVTPSPVAESDRSTFVAVAVAVYCPDYWDAVKSN